MCYSEKIKLLHKYINDAITPLTQGYHSCVYLDLPYHTNLGDLLIWMGTECFIREHHLHCTYRNSEETNHNDIIKEGQLIFLHGGGNFGDVWRSHQETRLNIIQRYHNHRIIMLPQTVWYDDTDLLNHDVSICAEHSDLYICARDRWSYDFLCKHFKNNILLVPDMAYCIPTQKIMVADKRTLYVERNDHELSSTVLPIDLPTPFDKRDWPTLGDDAKRFAKFYQWSMPRKLLALCFNTETIAINRFVHDWYLYVWLLNWNKKIGYRLDRFINCWMYRHLLGSVWQIGTDFLAAYKNVYSTRLHVCILSSLMQRSCELIDNNYGKNSNFYHTWLSDIKAIHLLNSNSR